MISVAIVSSVLVPVRANVVSVFMLLQVTIEFEPALVTNYDIFVCVAVIVENLIACDPAFMPAEQFIFSLAQLSGIGAVQLIILFTF